LEHLGLQGSASLSPNNYHSTVIKNQQQFTKEEMEKEK